MSTVSDTPCLFQLLDSTQLSGVGSLADLNGQAVAVKCFDIILLKADGAAVGGKDKRLLFDLGLRKQPR